MPAASLRERALPLLQALLVEAERLAGAVDFDPSDRQHLIAVSLLGSVLELARGAALTLTHGNIAASFVILRSALEAHVDLQNISEDHAYAWSMEATHLDQQRRVIKSSRERGAQNPYLASMPGNSSVDQHYAWILARLQELKEQGIQPPSVKRRFELAGELDLYEGPYASLSWESHNNINVLEARHLRESEHGYDVHYFQPPTDIDSQLVIDSLAGIVANSVASVKGTVEGAPPADLEDLTAKLSALRSLWKHS